MISKMRSNKRSISKRQQSEQQLPHKNRELRMNTKSSSRYRLNSFHLGPILLLLGCGILESAKLARASGDLADLPQLSNQGLESLILERGSSSPYYARDRDQAPELSYGSTFSRNNEPEVGQARQLITLRAPELQSWLKAIGIPARSVRQARSAVPLQLLEDESNLKNRLPDLIAQARVDKNFERALLRMLISAAKSLPVQSSVRKPPQQSSSSSSFEMFPRDTNGNIISDDVNSDLTQFATIRLLPHQLNDPYIGDQTNLNLMSNDQASMLMANELSTNSGGQQTGAVVNKREYIKPCSFNAVSCAKNPFRRL